MIKVDMEKVVKTLKNWGYNHGDFEELIVRLAEQDGFESIFATVPQPNLISFEYRLNEKGKEIAEEFAEEYGYTPISAEGYFHDDSPESVKNTLEEWGIEYVEE